MDITIVPPENTEEVWPVVEPMIKSALALLNGRYSSVDIFIAIKSGEQTLWVAFDEDKKVKGCCTVEIVQYPGMKCCNINVIAGEGVNDWLEDSFKLISKYAKEYGCERMEGMGRPGWIKPLKKLGWVSTAMKFDFLLTDGDE